MKKKMSFEAIAYANAFKRMGNQYNVYLVNMDLYE